MRWGTAFGIAALMLSFVTTAHAQGGKFSDVTAIRACNQSSKVIMVAKSAATGQQQDGKNIFLSQGWYELNPSQCITLWTGPLANRYYYVYAESQSSHWSGTFPMCVSEKAFRITDIQCGQGFVRRQFNQIDVGGKSGVFTYYFQGS
ncbi:MAG: DUF1036 domain-containing protein [Alphaproteobacteria bacterium]|nr:DUF1036 domain-containing protein [Alphaproteobacteria bacterium]